jgi:hypothetical protein
MLFAEWQRNALLRSRVEIPDEPLKVFIPQV